MSKIYPNPLVKTERFFSVLGDREKIKYQGRLDEDGTLRLIEVGKENLYEKFKVIKILVTFIVYFAVMKVAILMFYLVCKAYMPM